MGLFMTSCEEQLNLKPQQSLSTDLAFSDKRSAQGSLIGVYSQAQDLEVFGSMPQTISDYQSDNVEFIGSFPTLQEIYTFNTLSDNGSISTLWRDNYALILAANAVIKNVPNVEDPSFSAAEKAQYVAEAKFLRAITYFQMVNLFAQPLNVGGASAPGIPLVLEPFEGEVELPARASVGEVHLAIKADLEAAISGLTGVNAGAGRATAGAARAMLSRLHLYRGEYAEAANLGKQVISSGVYALASDYTFYNKLSKEDVFTIINTAIDNGRTGSGGWASYYMPAEDGARGDCPMSAEMIAAYNEEAGDKRFTTLNKKGQNGMTYSTKFPDAVNNTDNSPIIRFTEVYLNVAEALVEQSGPNAEALGLVNALRKRAGLAEWTLAQVGDKASFISLILKERRKELAFEGHRRMDLLRKGLPLRSTGPQASVSAPNAPKTILPIPQREVDLNTSLVQNTGY
jgi:hypothetical protein